MERTLNIVDQLPQGDTFTDNKLLSFLTKQPAVNLCDNLRHTNKVEHCFRGTTPHKAITQSVHLVFSSETALDISFIEVPMKTKKYSDS